MIIAGIFIHPQVGDMTHLIIGGTDYSIDVIIEADGRIRTDSYYRLVEADRWVDVHDTTDAPGTVVSIKFRDGIVSKEQFHQSTNIAVFLGINNEEDYSVLTNAPDERWMQDYEHWYTLECKGFEALAPYLGDKAVKFRLAFVYYD